MKNKANKLLLLVIIIIFIRYLFNGFILVTTKGGSDNMSGYEVANCIFFILVSMLVSTMALAILAALVVAFIHTLLNSNYSFLEKRFWINVSNILFIMK